ncbi:MAG TPA: amidohydrolase family protein [Steroidobacter sp.]
MSTAVRVICLCVLSMTAGVGIAQEHRDVITIVHAGWLLDVPGRPPKTRHSLIVESGKITQVRPGFVQPADIGRSADTVEIVNLVRSYVTPGLIDAHVHLTFDRGPHYRLERLQREDSDIALLAAAAARRTLEAGFTTVRDVGAHGHAIFALRDAVNAGLVPGPRILAAGAIISVTGGHGDEGGYRQDVLAALAQDAGVCDGADDCRKMVREQAKRGADVIKFTATGGVTSVTDRGVGQQFTDAEIEAIVTTARELGLKVAAHAHDRVGMDAALRAGVDSIEHGTFGDENSFELLRKSGAYVVPTQMTLGVAERIANDPLTPEIVRRKASHMLPFMREALPRMARAGVKLAFGTDAGTFPHGQNAGEFRYLKAAGIEPVEAIKMATINAADLLGLADEIGTLEPGKSADLIALSSDPTADTSALEHPTFVMRSGVVYKDLTGARSQRSEP